MVHMLISAEVWKVETLAEQRAEPQGCAFAASHHYIFFGLDLLNSDIALAMKPRIVQKLFSRVSLLGDPLQHLAHEGEELRLVPTLQFGFVCL